MKGYKLSVGVLFLLASSHLFYGQKETQEQEIETIVIQRSGNKNSENQLVELQKKSVEFVERVGSLQLEKQGVSDASLAVTKASGTQKQEGNTQVFVRGLGDRNNSTTFNGLPIPSNDPLYKNISLEIFKTDIIEYLSLEKIYHPKIWGDVAGANIDIASKVHSGKSYFKINLGSSANLNSLKKNNFYLQSGPEYSGFSKINKPTNSSFGNTGYPFKTSWKNKEIINPINSNFGFNFGHTFKIGNQGKLFLFGNGSFENEYKHQNGNFNSADNSGNFIKELIGEQNYYNTTTTGLVNLHYKINSKNAIQLTSNYIHSTEQMLENYSGYIRDTNENRNEETAILRRANYKINDVYINQISGTHNVSSQLLLLWNFGFNHLDSQRPDRMQNISIHNRIMNTNYFGASNPGANHRYYDQLLENEYTGNLEFKYELSEKSKIHAGYSGKVKKSDFEAIQYNFRINAAPGTYTIDTEDFDSFFNSENYSKGVFDVVTFRGDIRWNTNTALLPQFYQSEIQNNGAFLNLDYILSDKITVQAGVRYDHLNQKIKYNTSLNEGNTKKNYSKILPAFNVKYAVTDYMNLRLSGSKTYTTPLLLELAPYEYEEVDELSFGNPSLYPSDNYNLDIKWEWFPKRGEIFSLSAFGKHILNPISRVTVNSSSNAVSFVNIGDSGQVYGLELETRKTLFEYNKGKVYTFLNATYLHTKQKQDKEKVQNETTTSYSKTIAIDPIRTEDKIQGASDIIANLNLGFEKKWNNNTQADFILSYSYTSDNIYAIGYASKGNLVNKSIQSLDAIFKIKFNNGIGVTLNAKNLINPYFTRVQENENKEVIIRKYQKGINLGLGVSYQF